MAFGRAWSILDAAVKDPNTPMNKDFSTKKATLIEKVGLWCDTQNPEEHAKAYATVTTREVHKQERTVAYLLSLINKPDEVAAYNTA